jgi:hypothetical protein
MRQTAEKNSLTSRVRVEKSKNNQVKPILLHAAREWIGTQSVKATHLSFEN